MKMVIIDKDFLGFEIRYDPRDKRFEAWKNDEQVGSEKTQAELEDYLKKLKKKTFQRFTAIRSTGGREIAIGVITSFVKSHSYGTDRIEVWFTWKDENDQPQRRKLPLHSVYEATEERLEVANQMIALNKKLAELYKQYENLRNKLRIYLNYNDVLRLGGMSKGTTQKG